MDEIVKCDHSNQSYRAVLSFFQVFIIWLNWSMMNRSILIGSLSGPYFAIRTAKMDHSRTDFTDL